MGTGENLALVRVIAGQLSCRVGGGIRTVERAQEILAAGAQQIIVGSAIFKNGGPNLEFAKELSGAVGTARVIVAVDSRGGLVVVNGWKTELPLTPVEAVRALEPYCDEFLYTHVDTEGLMGGTNRAAILAVRRATSKRVTAAGGITTREEIEDLDRLGVDSVVGHGHLHGKTRSAVRAGQRVPAGLNTRGPAFAPAANVRACAARNLTRNVNHGAGDPVKAGHATPPPATRRLHPACAGERAGTGDRRHRAGLADGQDSTPAAPCGSTTFQERSRSPVRTGRT